MDKDLIKVCEILKAKVIGKEVIDNKGMYRGIVKDVCIHNGIIFLECSKLEAE
ncbi:MAG: hypothetical protein ACE5KD_00935 [Candidatus Bathyarchaeia archaeon]